MGVAFLRKCYMRLRLTPFVAQLIDEPPMDKKSILGKSLQEQETTDKRQPHLHNHGYNSTPNMHSRAILVQLG